MLSFVYDKRKGCRQDENLHNSRILDGHARLQKGTEVQTAVDPMTEKGNVDFNHAAFKVGSVLVKC